MSKLKLSNFVQKSINQHNNNMIMMQNICLLNNISK